MALSRNERFWVLRARIRMPAAGEDGYAGIEVAEGTTILVPEDAIEVAEKLKGGAWRIGVDPERNLLQVRRSVIRAKQDGCGCGCSGSTGPETWEPTPWQQNQSGTTQTPSDAVTCLAGLFYYPRCRNHCHSMWKDPSRPIYQECMRQCHESWRAPCHRINWRDIFRPADY